MTVETRIRGPFGALLGVGVVVVTAVQGTDAISSATGISGREQVVVAQSGRGQSGQQPLVQDPAGQFDAALERFTRLSAAGSVEAEARVRSVGLQAVEAFLRIPVEAPERQKRLLEVARVARRVGMIDRGIGFAEEAFRSGLVGSEVVDELLTGMLVGGRADDALERAFGWRERYPETVRRFVLKARFVERGALFQAAASRLRRGSTAIARFAYEEAASSGQPLDLANLALTLRHLGEFDQAIELYRRAVEQLPDDPILWSDFGLCLRAASKFEEALDAFRRSVEIEPAPGRGPATTNLLLTQRMGIEGVDGDPRVLADRVLGGRPEQELVRRFQIDLGLDRN